MTTRQIRIACCGSVVSILPVPEPLADDQLLALADKIIGIVDALRPFEYRVWVDEGNVARMIRRWE